MYMNLYQKSSLTWHDFTWYSVSMEPIKSAKWEVPVYEQQKLL